MKQYKIIEASNRYDLQTYVSEALKNGWKPQGGVLLAYPDAYKETWAQAMVKE